MTLTRASLLKSPPSPIHRFAGECMQAMKELVSRLESRLGPDTGELTMRFGLHSGKSFVNWVSRSRCISPTGNTHVKDLVSPRIVSFSRKSYSGSTERRTCPFPIVWRYCQHCGENGKVKQRMLLSPVLFTLCAILQVAHTRYCRISCQQLIALV